MLYKSPDDIQVNDFVCIHSHKEHDHLMPVFGHAFKVKAVNRPFFVMEHFGSKDRCTFDERMFQFMKVTEDFAKAQVAPPQPQQPQMMAQSLGQMLMGLQRRNQEGQEGQEE